MYFYFSICLLVQSIIRDSLLLYMSCTFPLVVPAPNITHHPENQVIELYTNNFNLTLQCKAVGYKIKYTWTKNHGTIVPNDHYVINDGNLNIINIKPSDEGRYQCTTSNTGGNSFSTYADVVIKGVCTCI